jgi:hypothetical protein
MHRVLQRDREPDEVFSPALIRIPTVYGPDEIRLMRIALDKSWAALAFARWNDESDARATRERLACYILNETAHGERRVAALTDNALGSLEPRCAQ